MKKYIGIALAVLMIIGLSTAVMAADVNVDFDVPVGFIDITTNGFDHTAWHPGSIGETNQFIASGGFHGNYQSSEGIYGKLNSFINTNSYAGGANFDFGDSQDFNVMSANHIYNVDGYFHAWAYGGDDNVAMNLKSIGSMYVWSEATNPHWQPCLQGSNIGKDVWTDQNNMLKTGLYLNVITSGLATMYHSNIWGWSNGETGTSSTDYGGGTNTVTATASGSYDQRVYGTNGYTFNGFTSVGGGTMSMTGTFGGAFSGTYSMSAY